MSKINCNKYLGLALGLITVISALQADAVGTAVQVDMVDNLAATVKGLINGPGAYVVDGIILGGAGYGSAIMRSPAPIIFGLISTGLFHIAVKLIG